MKLFSTIVIYFSAAFSLISYSVIITLLRFFTFPFDKKYKVTHAFGCFWGVYYIWSNPMWKVRYIGKQNYDRNKAYVMVSNHQGMSDIMALYGTFFHFKWVAKAELFNTPFVGYVLRINRYIKINRSNKKSMLKMIEDCIAAVQKGFSVLIFPEGTRSKDGSLRNFKDGAFVVALKTQSPILPIAINNSYKASFEKGLVKERANISVEVLPEIPYELFKDLSAKEIATMVRSKIEAHVNTNNAIL